MAAPATQTESLALKDIHLPDPISWWPPAPGWWLLLASLVVIVIITLALKKIRQRNQLKRTALSELTKISQQYKKDDDGKVLAQSLSILLRRANVSFYPRDDVASLTGEQWLKHLDNTSDKKGFITTGHALITAPYLPDNKVGNIDVNSLLALCESWIRAQQKKTAAGEHA